MKQVLVKNYGDFWVNLQEVSEQIQLLEPDELIEFVIQEGISLEASGLADYIKRWQNAVGRTSEQIQISCVNHQDRLPWKNVHPEQSACWAMSRSYWTDNVKFVTTPAVIGLFVSRRTVARNVIMYDCADLWPNRVLLSRTQHHTPEPWHDSREHFDHWGDTSRQNQIVDWYQNCPVTSIDNIMHRDQFDPTKNTNASLLEHYHKFFVELCLETMTLGGSFFPTEKIARPIIGLKPFVVYAARNYLANLQRLGFETFGDIWDESYDQFEGPERWAHMREVVENILSNPDLVTRCADIVDHNRQVLRRLVPSSFSSSSVL
jgi:hypothetical protein